MTQLQAEASGVRGTNKGTQLKPSGSSGLEMALAGSRNPDGSFNDLGVYSYLRTSSELGLESWYRTLYSANTGVGRLAGSGTKQFGFSVRCIMD